VSQPFGRLTASTQGFGRIDKLDGWIFYFLDLPKPNQPPGNGHKITDWEKFRAFAQTHGEKT
jgi:hypothetical protein